MIKASLKPGPLLVPGSFAMDSTTSSRRDSCAGSGEMAGEIVVAVGAAATELEASAIRVPHCSQNLAPLRLSAPHSAHFIPTPLIITCASLRSILTQCEMKTNRRMDLDWNFLDAFRHTSLFAYISRYIDVTDEKKPRNCVVF
ncbi:MAG: hypothetical protein REI95_07435 [Oxalicibacterium faecigallinarum]|nr:hypothetical protein [Oxalicibacterium faecigallinarum]MDQ7969461.1 hypothetical protein [Oxalicibacterium faecigallinarum]